MANTTNYGIPMPDPATDVDAEFYRLQVAWAMIDAIVKSLADYVDGKAAATHTHSISQVTGLIEALAGKMSASATFSLDDLTDVEGAAEAALGYILAKTSTGYVPISPAAAIGAHDHTIAQVSGLQSALDALTTAVGLKLAASGGTITNGTFSTGVISDDVAFGASAALTKKMRFDLAAHTAGVTSVITPAPRSFVISPSREQIGETIDVAGINGAAWPNLSGYRKVIAEFDGATAATGAIYAQVSKDNGATVQPTNYRAIMAAASNGGFGVQPILYVGASVALSQQNMEPSLCKGSIEISSFNVAAAHSFSSEIQYFATNYYKEFGFGYLGESQALNWFRLYLTGGVFTRGKMTLIGVR